MTGGKSTLFLVVCALFACLFFILMIGFLFVSTWEANAESADFYEFVMQDGRILSANGTEYAGFLEGDYSTITVAQETWGVIPDQGILHPAYVTTAAVEFLADGRYVFFFGDTGDTWLRQASTDAGANCEIAIIENPPITQLDCQGVAGEMVKVYGVATRPSTGLDPHVDVVFNPEPGGSPQTRWQGFWPYFDQQVYVPVVLK